MKSSKSLLFVFACALILGITGCGRTASRLGGKEHRQKLTPPNMKQFISISFDKRGSNTVKDVTYVATDGYIYTQEFKDEGLFEGVIRWVPHTESESVIQSRAISRWTGGVVNLKLPEDCKQVLGVDIGYGGSSERTKNLTYISNDGAIYSKEYREGFIDRNFEGWLEVKKP